jgi:hypothetical protein
MQATATAGAFEVGSHAGREAPFFPSSLIRSYSNANHITWGRIISESIDNELDAGARNIRR